MAQEKQFVLIEEETLREIIRKQYQDAYAIVLLSYICNKHKLDVSLTVHEACGVLNLSPRQIEQERTRCGVRSLKIGRGRIFSSFDLAMLAARLHARRTMSSLKTIPRLKAPGKYPKE